MSSRYDPKAVEAKWQERWERQRAGEVDLRYAEGKEYLLVDPALRSLGRLEAGQGRTDVLGDVLFRFLKMNGRKVWSPVIKGRREQLRRLDDTLLNIPVRPHGNATAPVDRDQPVAVVLVNGFSGVGIHTLLSIQKLFPGMFKD